MLYNALFGQQYVSLLVLINIMWPMLQPARPWTLPDSTFLCFSNREGRWTVMERDLSNPRTPVPEDAPSSPPPAAEPLMSNNASFYSLQSSYLLEEARARLERLLPKES